MLASKSLFLTSKSEMLTSKSLLESCVSADSGFHGNGDPAIGWQKPRCRGIHCGRMLLVKLTFYLLDDEDSLVFK